MVRQPSPRSSSQPNSAGSPAKLEFGSPILVTGSSSAFALVDLTLESEDDQAIRCKASDDEVIELLSSQPDEKAAAESQYRYDDEFADLDDIDILGYDSQPFVDQTMPIKEQIGNAFDYQEEDVNSAKTDWCYDNQNRVLGRLSTASSHESENYHHHMPFEDDCFDPIESYNMPNESYSFRKPVLRSNDSESIRNRIPDHNQDFRNPARNHSFGRIPLGERTNLNTPPSAPARNSKSLSAPRASGVRRNGGKLPPTPRSAPVRMKNGWRRRSQQFRRADRGADSVKRRKSLKTVAARSPVTKQEIMERINKYGMDM